MEKLKSFLEDFKGFKDKRLKRRFSEAVQGIATARTCRVLTIATNTTGRRKNALYTAKGIYRFLSNERVKVEDILSPYYERLKRELANEKEVVVALDFSPIEKPYARKMEGLSRIQKKDKKGQTNGYMMLSALALCNKKGGVAYASIYSPRNMVSQNLEVRKAMKHVHELFSDKSIIWVLDRQFDDQKNFWDVIKSGMQFVCRVHHNRLIEVGGRKRKLIDWGLKLPVKQEFETRMFIMRKMRRVVVSLSWESFTLKGRKLWLLRSEIVRIEGLKDLNRIDRRWWLLTNIPINSGKDAVKVWGYYRRRWAVEDFYKFLKESLGLEEFQLMKLKAIEKLVAMVIIVAAFMYDLSVSLEDEFIQFILTLGGWTGRNKPGKKVLLRGLSMVSTYVVVRVLAKEHNIDESQLYLWGTLFTNF